MLLEGGPEMISAPRNLRRWSPVLCLVLALAVTGVSCQVSEMRLEGLWLSDGYGLFAEISSTAVTLFEITAVSCLPSGDEVVATSQEPDGSLRLTFGHGQEATLTPETESTAVFQPIGTASYRTFRRVAARPAVCEEPIHSTPLTNFDVFWTTYKEHYPFFELKGVAWDAVRAQVRPTITDATTPEVLFDLLAETIAPLEDVHTSISAEAPDRYFQGFRPDPELPDATSVAEAWPLLSKRFDRALEIIESRYIQGELHSFCQDHLRFGRLAGELVYVWLDQESGYTDRPGFAAQLETLEEALDAVFTESGEARGLILDVRKNFGGSDILSLALASRLTEEDYLAYAKVARLNPDDPDRRTPPQERFVRAGSRPGFHGPVVQLIGPYTVSAGETLTQALMGRVPHVQRIGENTQGVFSDVLNRRLPNGWRFGLPNELFLTSEGTSFDGPGIPPDEWAPVFRSDDLDSGKDPALERAMEFLASR